MDNYDFRNLPFTLSSLLKGDRMVMNEIVTNNKKESINRFPFLIFILAWLYKL